MASLLYYDPDPAWRKAIIQLPACGVDVEIVTAATFEEVVGLLRAATPVAVVADSPYVVGASLLSVVRQRCGVVPFVLFMPPGHEREAIDLLNDGADRCPLKDEDVAHRWQR